MVFLRAGNPCKTPQEVLNSITASGNFALSDHGSKKDNFFVFYKCILFSVTGTPFYVLNHCFYVVIFVGIYMTPRSQTYPKAS